MTVLAKSLTPRLGFALSAAAYLLCAGAAYVQVLIHGQFLCDDYILLARIRQGQGIWDYSGADFYRPTISTALTLLWRLFGNDPSPYYVANVLLLVGAALLLRSIWIELTAQHSDPGKPAPGAFLVGLLFVLWATHSEAISWISGMTDGLSVFFGAAALLVFIRYRKRPSWGGFAGALVLLWLAMISKESMVAWAGIFIVVSFSLLPGNREWKMRAGEAAILCVLAIVYVLWRWHVLGHLIGGYGVKAHLSLKWDQLPPKAARHFGNAFVPFTQFVALWGGRNLAPRVTAVVCVGTAALLLRRFAKPKPTPAWARGAMVIMLLLALARIPYILGDIFTDEYGGRILLADLLLVAGATFAMVRWNRLRRLDTAWGFALMSVLAYYIYDQTFDKNVEWMLLGLYLLFAYISRPVRSEADETDHLARLGLTAFAAAFLAMGPTMTLRPEISGQDTRFAYGPSFFAIVALACVGLSYVRSDRFRYAIAIPGCVALAILTYENNLPWAWASDLSGQLVKTVRSMLPARRIYVLSAPGSVNAALLFRIGIEHVAEVGCLDDHVQVHNAMIQISAVKGDRVTAEAAAPQHYNVGLLNSVASRRFEPGYLIEADSPMTDGWFKLPLYSRAGQKAAAGLTIIGFRPETDHILFVDCSGTGVHVIR